MFSARLLTHVIYTDGTTGPQNISFTCGGDNVDIKYTTSSTKLHHIQFKTYLEVACGPVSPW